jgi:hypothetical protein
MHKCLLLWPTLFVLLVSPTYAGYDDAKTAYGKGDYARAYKELKPLAEHGDARAQFVLGVMSERGEGTVRDYVQAVNWYRQAIQQGHIGAKYNLRLMYYRGFGVVQNYVRVYVWWDLAAAQGDSDSQKARDKVAESMTPPQIAEAQRLSIEFGRNIKAAALVDAKTSENEFAGGDGTSREQAVIMKNAKSSSEAIPLEYQWIRGRCQNFKRVKQSLNFQEGRKYDVITIRCVGEDEKDVYFDITNCFGRGPDK